jgi:hypothetical protein
VGDHDVENGWERGMREGFTREGSVVLYSDTEDNVARVWRAKAEKAA